MEEVGHTMVLNQLHKFFFFHNSLLSLVIFGLYEIN
jgi:hypothetical protein